MPIERLNLATNKQVLCHICPLMEILRMMCRCRCYWKELKRFEINLFLSLFCTLRRRARPSCSVLMQPLNAEYTKSRGLANKFFKVAGQNLCRCQKSENDGFGSIPAGDLNSLMTLVVSSEKNLRLTEFLSPLIEPNVPSRSYRATCLGLRADGSGTSVLRVWQ